MNRRLAIAIQRLCPPALTLALTRFKHRFFPTPRYKRISRLLHKIGNPSCVLQGPFQGMAYIRVAINSAYLPKIVGTYERDLHAIMPRIQQLDPDVIIDVGCAEGYYAVGLARMFPRCRVIAYDTLKLAQHLCNRLACLNRVQDRVCIRGFCSTTELDRILATAVRPLIVCDCEGFEDELLRPAVVPHLQGASILVEIHDRVVPGISENMRERFLPTHHITRIDETPRFSGDLPPDHLLAGADIADAMEEDRGYLMHWFFMAPNSRAFSNIDTPTVSKTPQPV